MLTERSERIRAARKLIRRSARSKTGLFLAEGQQAVREAIEQGPDRVVELFVTDGPQHHDLVAAADTAGIAVRYADDKALAGLSETVTPQGIVAVCRSVTVGLDQVLHSAPQLIAVLAEARDPGNSGTVIRCADAAGADAVVLSHGSVDPEGGKSVRASAGSIFHLPIAVGDPAAVVVQSLKDAGLTVLAADGAGDKELHDPMVPPLLVHPTAWLFGNEARGLSADIRDLADHVVRVPIYGRAESLNLATAVTVCLYESARVQRPRQ